jgi:hypothetical protein
MFADLRVSTDRQSRSGLDLDAQRGAIRRVAQFEGLEFVGEHVEVETGKGVDALELRPLRRIAIDKGRKLKVPHCRREARPSQPRHRRHDGAMRPVRVGRVGTG